MRDCLCGGEPRIIDECISASCHVVVTCMQCGVCTSIWSYPLLWPDSVEFYREDAINKAIREWDNYAKTNSAVSTNG